MNELRSAVLAVCPPVLAFTALLSLQPYQTWSAPIAWLLFGAVLSALVFAAVVALKPPVFDWLEAAGALLIALFLVYISLQKKTDGGHVPWIFVLPTLAALFVLDQTGRSRAMVWFAWMFSVSLLPGLLYWALSILGVPLSFDLIPTRNATMASAGVNLLLAPGAVFIESNRVALPWGGTLFRLCGMFDEPGTVGTIAAFTLAALRFRLNKFAGAICLIGGLASFSLAFLFLASVGFVVRACAMRSWRPIAALMMVLMASAVPLGFVGVSAKGPTNISAQGDGARSILPGDDYTIRQASLINNRSLPLMTALFERYKSSDWRTRIFGIASDASVVADGVSQHWTRILTNHGILGFVLLTLGCGLICLSTVRQPMGLFWPPLFFLLFAASAYQRPVVWLPYGLFVLMCGAALCRTQGDGARLTWGGQRAAARGRHER